MQKIKNLNYYFKISNIAKKNKLQINKNKKKYKLS
jgi:hypothetical protein